MIHGFLAALILTLTAQVGKVDQAKVDEAVKKAFEYLKSVDPPPTAINKHVGRNLCKTEIVLWTYLRGGMKPSEFEFQALFKDMMDRPLEATYAVSLQAMILEDLDRVKYQWRILKCAQFLVDNQSPGGQWSYGDPSQTADTLPGGDKTLDASGPVRPKPKVVKKLAVRRSKEGSGFDNSNSAYAIMGLRACADAGVLLPPEVIASAEKWWRECYHASGQGWCYSRHEEHKAYGSMTASGVASLAILGYLKGAKKVAKADPQLSGGLQWLGKNYSVSYHPGPYEHAKMEENSQQQFFYWMETLERAMAATGTESLARHDWYAEGVDSLLKLQEPNGRWYGAAETCFAIQFLVRATPPLESDAKK